MLDILLEVINDSDHDNKEEAKKELETTLEEYIAFCDDEENYSALINAELALNKLKQL